MRDKSRKGRRRTPAPKGERKMKKRTFPRLLFLLLLMLTALLLCIGAAAEPQPEPETTIISGESGAQPVLLASQISPSGIDYGYASFQFRQSGVKAIYLHSGEYINDCKGDTVPTMWQSTDKYPDIYDFIRDGDYKALHYQGFLYLKGELDLHGANINVDQLKLGFGISPKIYVKDNASLYNSDNLIYSYDTGVEIFIPTGKKLELNAVFPGVQKYPGAIRVAGELTITGGGRLDILYTLINTESGTTPRTLFGIYGGEGVTLRGNKYDGTGPTVNIKMDSGAFGPEANDVVGIRSGGDLIIQDDSKVKIEMLGHKLGQKTTEEDVNRAIIAKRLELLNNASLEILSHKNIIHDIVLTAESGDVLKVDTTGFLNIRNKGNIQRYDEGTWQHLQFDYPKSNIHLFKGSAQGARANIIRAEQGVKIESFSSYIDKWYNQLNDPEQEKWNWAISGTDGDPALGTNMYRGNRRIDNLVKVDDRTSIYTWGSIEYIYEPQGVVTVQKSNGLIMKHHAPEDNPHGSHLYYAKVLEPNFNDIHVLRKGESIELTTTGTKGTFLYWYDALRPEGSGSGTSWKNLTQKFTNIQRDMVLVPVYDPMKNGPTLSDVGYDVQWDDGVTKQTRYAYQDMTFAKKDDISTSGGYEVMLVPAQLPAYGVNTYAVDDLHGNPLLGLRNARLYADKNASTSPNGWWLNIPTGSYRIAYNDDATGSCFFSKPFTFEPPVAPPYISPITKIYDAHDGGVKTVTITAERNARIRYCLWDYAKNKWGGYIDYNEPFDVPVTADRDVRIEAYAGAPALNRRSEVRYALQPTGVPTVKHGDTVVSDGIRRYFYGSIELTVEAPEGYEVWYLDGSKPYESDGVLYGTPVDNGKVTITDDVSNGILYFVLAKAFTVDGVQYRKLSHKYASVHLTKLDELPAPKVTVTTKEGGQTLYPDGSNTYTMTENVVTVTLEPNGNWPLDATIAYDTKGGATPRLSTTYTQPFDVRGAGTISVFTLVPKANGEYDYERKAYTFKLAESLERVTVSVFRGDCTAYYTKEDGTEGTILADDLGRALKVGTKVRVVPNPPTGKVFKKWEISNYEEWDIWGTYGVGDYYYSPELVFYVPKPRRSSPTEIKTLGIKATFATAAEAKISGQTLVDLDMSKTVNDSISLHYTTKEMRTISFRWWVGDSAGTEATAMFGAVPFDPDKTYTVEVTIKANSGASFAPGAGVAIGGNGGHFTVPNDKIERTGSDTLTFTATPIRQFDLTMPAPLTVGDPLPTISDVGGVPEGVTIQKLEWPYTSGNTVPETNYGDVRATLTLKTDGTRPILTREYPNPTVNGEISGWYARNKNEDVTDGSIVKINVDLPVKPMGVRVSGTALSWNDSDDARYYLYPSDTADEVILAQWKTGGTVSGYTCTGTGAAVTAMTVDGKRMQAQAFSFDTVAAGEYKLVIFKPKRYVPKIVHITVDSTALDLGQLKLWLYGDVNYDGWVLANDATQIVRRANGIGSVFDTGDTATKADRITAADLNADGTIRTNDAAQITRFVNGLGSVFNNFK